MRACVWHIPYRVCVCTLESLFCSKRFPSKISHWQCVREESRYNQFIVVIVLDLLAWLIRCHTGFWSRRGNKACMLLKINQNILLKKRGQLPFQYPVSTCCMTQLHIHVYGHSTGKVTNCTRRSRVLLTLPVLVMSATHSKQEIINIYCFP